MISTSDDADHLLVVICRTALNNLMYGLIAIKLAFQVSKLIIPPSKKCKARLRFSDQEHRNLTMMFLITCAQN
jgi:hypothetical protein